MKKTISILTYVCLTCVAQALLPVSAIAQNWTTVSASNITDLNQNKLAAGQLCFLGTDQNDNPISFNIGGGGQSLRRAYCSGVSNGAVTSFTVPNPASTAPSGIYYRVTGKDSNTGQEVLRYTQVTFTGGTFNFDNYAPTNVGSFNPPTGTATPGNLTVNGNLSVTGSLSGSITCGQLPALTGDATSSAGSCALALATVGIAKGGTSQTTAPAAFNALSPMTTLGDIEYESGANTASRLAGNTTTTKKYLSQTGNGSVSAAPAWVQVAAADLSDGNTGTGPIVHGTNPAIASPSTTGTDNGSETLQNKTLTGASSGNSVTLLNEQGPVSQLTGNSSAQTMYTYTLAANTLGAGKGVRIRCWVQHTVGSAAISYTIQFGGSSFFTATLVDTATQNEYFESTIFNNTGVTNAQHGIGWGIFAGSGAGLDNPFTAAIDTTAAVIIKATFNVANTDKVTPAEWIVEFVQ